MLEFVLCIGHQKDRPQVGGAGRLIDMEVERSQSATRRDDRDADAEPALVSISNLEELATTLNDSFLPDLAEAIGQPAAGEAAQEPRHEPEDQVSYALTQNEALVLKTLGLFDSSILVSAATIEREMDPRERISNRTINTAVRRLIEIGLAERPEGPRRGCRLTRAGRVQMRKIAD
ncbi:MAG TPA: hypothetical protein ENJ00_03135 [Phycisphaerales bacterium]|nr:hypothetical protein [Phycisphaerales bacterium]